MIDGSPGSQAPLDQLAEEMQALRLACGAPSFSVIASRITATRVADGMSPERARIAKTTVYDAFRTGRARISVQLVGEIVLALTDDTERATEWLDRATAAQTAAVRGQGVAPRGQPVDADEGEPPPSAPTRLDAATGVQPQPEAPGEQRWRPLSSRRGRWGFALLAVVANLLLKVALEDAFAGAFPLFCDMIATAAVSMSLGLWWGVAAGTAMNVGLVGVFGPVSLVFLPVQWCGALVWSRGSAGPTARVGSQILRQGLVAGFLCSATSLTMTGVFLRGDLVQWSAIQLAAGANHLPAVVARLLANLGLSLADKLLATLVASSVVGRLASGFVRRPLVPATTAPQARQSP